MQYPKVIKCKYKPNAIVWILFFDTPHRAIITKIDCDELVNGHPTYDLQLLDRGATEVDPDSGSITVCNREEWLLYDEEKGAIIELYRRLAGKHQQLEHTLRICVNFLHDDPDRALKALKKWTLERHED